MARKKSINKNNVIKLPFGGKAVSPVYDITFTVNDRSWYLIRNYGLRLGQEICFNFVSDFFDGDYIALEMQSGSYYHGFGYHLANSILIGQLAYQPCPRSKIKRIAKLANLILIES